MKKKQLLYPALLGVHLEELSFSELLTEDGKDWVHNHRPTTPEGDEETRLASHLSRRVGEHSSQTSSLARQTDEGTHTVVVTKIDFGHN